MDKYTIIKQLKKIKEQKEKIKAKEIELAKKLINEEETKQKSK